MDSNDVGKGTLQITSTNIIQYAVMALFYVIIAKTNSLTPSDLGVLSILTFFTQTLALVLFGLPTALTKYVSQFIAKGQLEKAAYLQKNITKISILISLIGSILCVLFSSQLSIYFWGNSNKITLIFLIAIEAFFINLLTLYKSKLRGLWLFGKMGLITIIYIIFSRFIAIFLALLGFGISGVLIGFIIGAGMGVFSGIFFTRGKFPESTSKLSLMPIIKFSFPLFLSALALFIIGQLDVLVLASFVPDDAIGIYSIAVKSLQPLTLVWQPIMITIFPMISAKFMVKNPQNVERAINTASRYLFYTIIPCSLILVVIAPTALEVFYGTEYVAGSFVLRILAISITIFAFWNLLTTTLTAIARTKQVLVINLVSAFSSILFFIIFIPVFDLIGAAVSKFLSYIIGTILTIYFINKHMNLDFDFNALLKAIFSSICVMLCLFGVELLTPVGLPSLLLLGLNLIIAGIVYVFTLYVFHAFDDKDFQLLRQAFPPSFRKIFDFLQKLLVRK